MTEQESFNQIDSAIEYFKHKEGLHKDIRVIKSSHSDWLLLHRRQLSWTENDINYLIEVHPSFDAQQNLIGWNIYAAAYYDRDQNRYYTKMNIADNTSLDFIANNSQFLILKGYQFLSNIKKEQIPFVVNLK